MTLKSSSLELSRHPFINNYFEDFTYINIKNVLNKVNKADLYINIKDNKTICSIVSIAL